METKDEIKGYANDVRDLPIWLKYALALFAILGTFGTLFGAWGTLLYSRIKLLLVALSHQGMLRVL